jgi:hypothetical protein
MSLSSARFVDEVFFFGQKAKLTVFVMLSSSAGLSGFPNSQMLD